MLTTLILYLGTYDLKGLYALEEYYARDLKAYYEALTVGPSLNYYLGRADADITGWIAYFIDGTAASFENIRKQATCEAERGGKDRSKLLRDLDSKQRRALTLFAVSREVTGKDVAASFGYKPRTAAMLCQRWVEQGFLETTDSARKSRRHKLSDRYIPIVDEIY